MDRGRSRYQQDDDDSRYSAAARWNEDGNMGRGAEDAWDFSSERALVPRKDGGLSTVPLSDAEPLIVPGNGVPMGTPFIKRRERPLSLRLAVIGLMSAILLTGIFAATPMSTGATGQVSAFQALAGAMVLQKNSFFYYTAQPGDDVEALAKQFHVELGGIYELNSLLAGQELIIGRAYKIPTDPTYGATYRPPAYIVTTSSGGGNVFGSNWWNSVSGTPDEETTCGPDGHGNPLGYKLYSPNWGSHWVRGFSWYHNGDDLAATDGNTIHAAQSGLVVWAGWDGTNGLGWSVKLNNCNHISTLYGHMQKVLVKPGDHVLAGDPIGLEGSTGWSTGPHLHFMVEWDNNPVDPFPYFASTYTMTHYVA
ncbi:MAG TPA: LysM peptidoglycan-binding domain-containing M23 family metallopeptidase [Ktedonobacterales bacterium]